METRGTPLGEFMPTLPTYEIRSSGSPRHATPRHANPNAPPRPVVPHSVGSPRHKPFHRYNQSVSLNSTLPRKSSPQTTSSLPASPSKSAPKTPGSWRSKNNTQNNQPASDGDLNKVLVTGFAPYTQANELAYILLRFGTVKVDMINNRIAKASYSKQTEAQSALEASNKISVNGEFLTVKPFSAAVVANEKNRRKHNKPRRDNKTKEIDIIQPDQINISGDFYQQVDQILAAIRLTQEEVQLIMTLYDDLQQTLRAQWPECVARPFGSITTGLGTKSSDADCFIYLPQHLKTNNDILINKAKRLLQLQPEKFTKVVSIPRANTPIIKFFHTPTKVNCDVSFKTLLGVQNSSLIAFLLRSDPRLIPLAVLIKYWAKIHQFSGTGKLTNYTLVMMIIFYLQQPPMSILPSVEWLQRDPAYSLIVDSWETGFMDKPELLPPSSNTSSLAELLGGFFEFYSTFNFEEIIVCPYLGRPMKKTDFANLDLLPSEFERYKQNLKNRDILPLKFTSSFCVQDPLELCHNVACGVSSRVAADIKSYIKFAANAYEKEKLQNCTEFLKILLLQVPDIIQHRKNVPGYKVTILSKALLNLTNCDWKAVVRKTIFTVFEKFLKITITTLRDKNNTDGWRQREKYIGTMNRALWRNRNIKTQIDVTNMELIQKEIAITEEILQANNETIKLQFEINITFFKNPRTVLIALRLSDGDVETFREFGKFIVGNQWWFLSLLKPKTDKIDEGKVTVPSVREADTTVREDDTKAEEIDTKAEEADTKPEEADTSSELDLDSDDDDNEDD